MTTESVISSPRLDRKFVDGSGNLTQNAYALLYGLLTRTGGQVATVIDVSELTTQLDDLAVRPPFERPPVDDPLTPPIVFTEPQQLADGRLVAMEAEVAKLRAVVDGLTQGLQA